MKKLRRIVLKIMNAISVVIIFCSIAVLLTIVFTKSGEAPNFFGYSMFRVMTGSMAPKIPTDALIVVRHVDPDTLSVGDVITFYSRDPSIQGEINTHRIVQMERNGQDITFYTKGDANNVEDRYPTKKEDLIGKVIYSSVGLGKLIRLISNPLLFIPLIILPLAFLLISSIAESITIARKLAREEEEAAVREAVEAIRKEKKEKEV